MNGKRVLWAILIVQILIISGIASYTLISYAGNNIGGIQHDTSSGIAAKIISINDDEAEYQEFSVSELALDYLSADSKIVAMGADGIRHYNGSGANTTHCRTYIYLQSDFSATSGARYVMSCAIVNPAINNLPDLPFGNSDITIETEVKKDNLFHSKLEDATVGITLDQDTYKALLRVLQYYSGNGNHDDYLEDPLASSNIEHSFTITEPHFTPL